MFDREINLIRSKLNRAIKDKSINQDFLFTVGELKGLFRAKLEYLVETDKLPKLQTNKTSHLVLPDRLNDEFIGYFIYDEVSYCVFNDDYGQSTYAISVHDNVELGGIGFVMYPIEDFIAQIHNNEVNKYLDIYYKK